jgi:hypothetical protein
MPILRVLQPGSGRAQPLPRQCRTRAPLQAVLRFLPHAVGRVQVSGIGQPEKNSQGAVGIVRRCHSSVADGQSGEVGAWEHRLGRPSPFRRRWRRPPARGLVSPPRRESSREMVLTAPGASGSSPHSNGPEDEGPGSADRSRASGCGLGDLGFLPARLSVRAQSLRPDDRPVSAVGRCPAAEPGRRASWPGRHQGSGRSPVRAR